MIYLCRYFPLWMIFTASGYTTFIKTPASVSSFRHRWNIWHWTGFYINSFQSTFGTDLFFRYSWTSWSILARYECRINLRSCWPRTSSYDNYYFESFKLISSALFKKMRERESENYLYVDAGIYLNGHLNRQIHSIR